MVKFTLVAACIAAIIFYQRQPPAQGVKAEPSPQRNAQKKTTNQSSQSYGPAVKLADLEDPAIQESSGLVASRTTPGLHWTHNDSGDGPFIYAFDERGRRRGVWRVAGAKAYDWEDIAAGPGPARNLHYLYIGDIGDNSSSRSEIVVYRIPEPRITAADATASKSKPRTTELAEVIRLVYPDGKHDAEALLVHPVTGNLYVITKTPFANPGIYEAVAPLTPDRTITLVHVGELNVPSLFGGIITGAAITHDGRRIALCDYMQGYELVLPVAASSFAAIWKQPMRAVALGQRRQGEAITYRLDGKALLATSEGLPTPLIQVVQK